MYPNSALFPLDENLQNSSVVVGTPVLGVIVSGAAEVINLQEPVVITLPITVDSNEVYTRIQFLQSIINFTKQCISHTLYADIHREQLPSMCVLELHCRLVYNGHLQ